MYFIALDESCKLAQVHRAARQAKCTDKEKLKILTNDSTSGSYKTFKNSPASRGVFQFDLWREEQKGSKDPVKYPLTCPWDKLREEVKEYGLRNSLLVAPMPTGTTSSIMGNSPCFEPHNSLFYKRRNKSGEFPMANSQLINDLMELGLWSSNTRDKIQADPHGSISKNLAIPLLVRKIYKTVWDIKIKDQIDLALTREVFIDQSQSFSWFEGRPTIAILSQFHAYGWRRGRKTSSYYTRRLAVVDAQKIQIVKTSEEMQQEEQDCGNKGFCGS